MPDGVTFNSAVSSAGPASPLMRERFSDSFGTWTARKVLGDIGDRLMGGARMSQQTNYHRLFGLGDANTPRGIQQVGLRGLNWQSYSNAVRANFSTAHLPREGVGSYLKGTVYHGNVDDITNLFRRGGSSSASAASATSASASSGGSGIGTGLAKLGGLGFMAFDTLKGAKETHDLWSAQEDGSFGSKMRTWMETGETLVKKAGKNLLAWEAASAGFAIGTALVPVAGPLGIVAGIGLGALTGAGAKTLMDKIMPDRSVPAGSGGEANDGNPATVASTAFATVNGQNPFEHMAQT